MVDTQCCLFGLRRNYIAFWVSGLLNNFLYVVMNAGANSINESGIGFVYLANVVPTLFVKATGPYWFHLVSYRRRVLFCALMMVSSLMTVAWSDTSHLKLLGVCMASVSVGIGESSFLGMAAFYDKQPCIKSWSSGTGFAGIAGYMWAILFGAIGACFQVQLMMGLWIPLAWVLTFECLLERPWIDTVRDDLRRGHSIANDEIGALKFGIPYMDAGDAQTVAATGEVDRPITEYLSFRSRFMFIIRLWPYMVPLTTVFAAEYTIQAGFWTVIGFPVTDKKSRQEWYRLSNFAYQVGVCISRSSFGGVCTCRSALWLGGALQAAMVLLFWWAAAAEAGSWWLLAPCLVVGFLGGGVYVGAFSLIAREQEERDAELALSSASLADSLGIALADVLGVVVQGCMFGRLGVSDTRPDFTCGYAIWGESNASSSAGLAAERSRFCFPGLPG